MKYTYKEVPLPPLSWWAKRLQGWFPWKCEACHMELRRVLVLRRLHCGCVADKAEMRICLHCGDTTYEPEAAYFFGIKLIEETQA
jgi:hypothetical protein